MISILGKTQSFTIPPRVRESQTLNAPEAEILQRVFLARMRALVTFWLEKKAMSVSDAQAYLALECERFTFGEIQDPADPISAEALRIAKAVVRKKLAQAGLDITDESLLRHATEVAKLDSVRKMAEDVVSVRHAKALEALGVH